MSLLGKSAKKALKMDKASRLKRAEELGFDPERIAYHGTAEDIRSFDPLKEVQAQRLIQQNGRFG